MSDSKSRIIKQAEFVKIFKERLEKTPELSLNFCLGPETSQYSGYADYKGVAKACLDKLRHAEENEWLGNHHINESNCHSNFIALVAKVLEKNLTLPSFDENERFFDKGLRYLAQILIRTQCNYVITANLDSEIEKAFQHYLGDKSEGKWVLSSKPLEGEIALPTIVKPLQKTTEGSPNWLDNWKSAVSGALNSHTTIIVGFSDADKQFEQILCGEQSSNRQSIFWFSTGSKEIPKELTSILSKKDLIIQIPHIEGLMHALADIWGIVPPKDEKEKILSLFKKHKEKAVDTGTCFFLGSGTSVTSGIKSGAAMAKEWFREIEKEPSNRGWIKKYNISEDECARYYSKLFEKCFELHPQMGLDYLQEEMEGKKPAKGYDYLAQILNKGVHNIVITTNFDHLLESALFEYNEKSPLIIGHESLAQYIKPQNKSPMLIKLHHDLFFAPKNSETEINQLSEFWQAPLKIILNKHPLLVIGYGGNDDSVMEFLRNIPPSKREAIFWCVLKDEMLQPKVELLLTKKDRIVEIEGFDEFMESLAIIYNITPYKDFDSINEFPLLQQKAARSVSLILKNKFLPNTKLNQDDIEDICNFYYESLGHYPLPAIQLMFARFLHYKAGRLEKAKEQYKNVLGKIPDHAECHFHFGRLQHDLANETDNCELLENALLHFEIARKRYESSAKYHFYLAELLSDLGRDKKTIEAHYLKATTLSPENAEYHFIYAEFLQAFPGRLTESLIEQYKLAVKFAPGNIEYNVVLASNLLLRNQSSEAKPYLTERLERGIAEQNYEDIPDLDKQLLLEANFYRLLYFPEFTNQALGAIQMYLDDEVRIPEADLETHFACKGTINSDTIIDKAKSLANKATGRDY